MDVNVSVTLTLRATVNAESWASRRGVEHLQSSAELARALKSALEGFSVPDLEPSGGTLAFDDVKWIASGT
jgi:hypothetical protein